MSSSPNPRGATLAGHVRLLVLFGFGVFAILAIINHESVGQVFSTGMQTWAMLRRGEPILVQEDYWSGIRLIDRVRQETLDAGLAGRNFLQSRSSESRGEQRDLLAAARRELVRATHESDRLVVPPALLGQWSRIRQVADEYTTLLDGILAERTNPVHPASRQIEQLSVLQTSLLRELARLNEQMGQISRQEKQVLVFTDQVEQQLYWMLLIGLFLALATLGIPTAHAWAAQKRLRAEHEETLIARQNMEKVSAKLVRAQEEERRTISRELHDEIGQLLTAARLDLASLESRIPEEMTELRFAAMEGKDLVEQSLRRVRDLTQLLRPSLLDEQGLVSAVKWLVRGFGNRTGIDIELEAQGLQDRLPTEYEITIFRMVQECLNNISKHSGATAAKVLIANNGVMLTIRVEDNGSGLQYSIKSAASVSGGLGLLGMRERVESLGGRLRFVSMPKGLCLLAEMPLPSGPQKAVSDETLRYKTPAAS